MKEGERRGLISAKEEKSGEEREKGEMVGSSRSEADRLDRLESMLAALLGQKRAKV